MFVQQMQERVRIYHVIDVIPSPKNGRIGSLHFEIQQRAVIVRRMRLSTMYIPLIHHVGNPRSMWVRPKVGIPLKGSWIEEWMKTHEILGYLMFKQFHHISSMKANSTQSPITKHINHHQSSTNQVIILNHPSTIHHP